MAAACTWSAGLGQRCALSVLVRHAQDIELTDEGLFAEAQITVRRLMEPITATPDWRQVYRGLLRVPTGRLTIGDADDEVAVQAHSGDNLVVISVDASTALDDTSPESVEIDLLPG